MSGIISPEEVNRVLRGDYDVKREDTYQFTQVSKILPAVVTEVYGPVMFSISNEDEYKTGNVGIEVIEMVDEELSYDFFESEVRQTMANDKMILVGEESVENMEARIFTDTRQSVTYYTEDEYVIIVRGKKIHPLVTTLVASGQYMEFVEDTEFDINERI